MEDVRLLLVGPRMCEIRTGVSAGLEMLIEELRLRSIPVRIVDTHRSSRVVAVGSIEGRKLLVGCRVLWDVWRALGDVDTLYMTVASSRGGCLRDLAIMMMARLRGVRVVGHLKGAGFRGFFDHQPAYFKYLIRAVYGGVDVLIVLGDSLREQFAFLRTADEKIQVVHNAPPDEPVPISEVYRTRSVPPRDGIWRFLYLSNLMRTKGYQELLEACALLNRSGFRNFHCEFCGDFVTATCEGHSQSPSELAAEFKTAIKVAGLEETVTFHGTVAGEEKHRLLASSHVLVLPTYYLGEGQPLCILEAFAHAMPVITTCHGGIPDQVEDGYNGRFVPARDPGALASAMREMCENVEVYRSLGRNAYETYESRFSRRRHVENMLRILGGERLTRHGEDDGAGAVADCAFDHW